MNPKNITKLGELLSKTEIPRYVILSHISNNICELLKFLRSTSFVPTRELAELYILETSCSDKGTLSVSDTAISDCLKYYKANIEEFFNTRKSIILEKLIDILFTEIYRQYDNSHMVRIDKYSFPKIPLGHTEIIEDIIEILEGNKPISSLASIEVLHRDIITDIADNIIREDRSCTMDNTSGDLTEEFDKLKDLLKKYAYVHTKDTHELSFTVVIKILEILFWGEKNSINNINVKQLQYIISKEYNGQCNFPITTPYRNSISPEEIVVCGNPIRLLLSIDYKLIPQNNRDLLSMLVCIIFMELLGVIKQYNTRCSDAPDPCR